MESNYQNTYRILQDKKNEAEDCDVNSQNCDTPLICCSNGLGVISEKKFECQESCFGY